MATTTLNIAPEALEGAHAKATSQTRVQRRERLVRALIRLDKEQQKARGFASRHSGLASTSSSAAKVSTGSGFADLLDDGRQR